MANSEGPAMHKDSLMHEINTLFAPPTAESYGKKGLAGIPSLRRARKGLEGSASAGSDPALSHLDQFPPISTTSSLHLSQAAGRDDPFWKKPRANCHEYCDSCGCNEGERLVCDRCPASFHLECLDPPVEPDDAPIGVWFCHRCLMILKDEEDQASTSSSHSTVTTDNSSTRPTKVSGRSTVGVTKRTDNTNQSGPGSTTSLSGASSTVSKRTCMLRAVTNERALTGRCSRSAAWGESAYIADTDESDLRVLWDVIKYAQHQNPKEFELPKDLLPGIKLPGSYRPIAERKRKVIIELENGSIPRPVRRCYICARTCMLAPLLPCDYCSACFHLDCLNPPLSHFPPRSDRWMCPNHIEHTTDRYLTRSIRLTERMQIWADLAQLSKSNENESNRTLSNVETDLSAFQSTFGNDVLSDEVKPDPEVTGSYDSITSKKFHSNMHNGTVSDCTKLVSVAPYELVYGPDEEAIILADLLRKVQRGRVERSFLQSSGFSAGVELALHTRNRYKATYGTDGKDGRGLWRFGKSPSSITGTLYDRPKRMRIVVPTAVKAMYADRIMPLPRKSTCASSPASESDRSTFARGLLQFYLGSIKESNAGLRQEQLEPSKGNGTALKVPLLNSDAKHPDTINQAELSQQLCSTKVDVDAEKSKHPLTDSEHTLKGLLNRLDQMVKSGKDVSSEELAKCDFPLILSLARLQVHCLSQDKWLDAPCLFSNPTSNSLRARAVLTPCGTTIGPNVRMCYRQLKIGTSPDCHLCLNNYRLSNSVRCAFVNSSHHATIFYDEWTHHFELLNYSEYGSRVDGITYGNDATIKLAYQPKPSALVSRVRGLIENRKQDDFSERSTAVSDHDPSSKRPVMLSRLHESLSQLQCACECINMDSSGVCNQVTSDNCSVEPKCARTESGSTASVGWEGPAVLKHGSFVQFGCYKFVLGLINHAVNDVTSLRPPVDQHVNSNFSGRRANELSNVA